MKKIKYWLKAMALLLMATLYLTFIFSNLATAEPAGADVSNAVTDTGPTSNPGSRSDDGGTITTIDLDVTQQNDAWKGYVGNITGKLVLRNTDSFSIYEWAIDSTALSGNVFVSRTNAVNWTTIECGNETHMIEERTNLTEFTFSDSDNINKTFNYTIHPTLDIASTTILNSTCPTTFPYVNGTRQENITETNNHFYEVLLSDTSYLVYATIVDQDAWAYANNNSINRTYDFQLIVPENRTATVGTTYYFYADIA